MPFATTTSTISRSGIGYWITVLIVGALLAAFFVALTSRNLYARDLARSL